MVRPPKVLQAASKRRAERKDFLPGSREGIVVISVSLNSLMELS